MKLILRILINALALLAITQFVQGFHVESLYYAIVAALVIGLLNAVVRPVLVVLTLPITVLTLGLFIFVINALIMLLAASFLQGFAIDGFWTAMFAAIILFAVSLATNWLLKSPTKNEA